MSNSGHWANGVKEDNLTGLSLLTKDGFIGQDNQTGKNYRSNLNGMEYKQMKGNEESFNTFKRREIDWLSIKSS